MFGFDGKALIDVVAFEEAGRLGCGSGVMDCKVKMGRECSWCREERIGKWTRGGWFDCLSLGV